MRGSLIAGRNRRLRAGAGIVGRSRFGLVKPRPGGTRELRRRQGHGANAQPAWQVGHVHGPVGFLLPDIANP
jgi:hypothetical protein